jgi:hypothetical protein
MGITIWNFSYFLSTTNKDRLQHNFNLLNAFHLCKSPSLSVVCYTSITEPAEYLWVWFPIVKSTLFHLGVLVFCCLLLHVFVIFNLYAHLIALEAIYMYLEQIKIHCLYLHYVFPSSPIELTVGGSRWGLFTNQLTSS